MVNKTCKNCKHLTDCGVLRLVRFGSKKELEEFRKEPSDKCKDWEEKDA